MSSIPSSINNHTLSITISTPHPFLPDNVTTPASQLNMSIIDNFNETRVLFGLPGDEIPPEVSNRYLIPYYRDTLKIEILILYALLIAGVLTNLYALIQIASKNQIKSGSNILLLHLIIVDLFVAVFAILPQIIWCQSISWEIGNFACKLSQTLRYFSLYSSSFMVVCISYNRYYLLKEPHIFQKEKQRAFWMLKTAYISSFLLSIPQFFIHEVARHPQHNYLQCVGFKFFRAKWELRAYNFYTLLGMYIIPLKLIILLYSKIIASLNLNKYVIARMSKSASSEERLSQKTNCMLKTKRKAINTFLAVTISFTVCWTPYCFIILWQVFSGQEQIINPDVTNLMYMFALLSCTFNPIAHSSHLYRTLICCKRSGSNCRMPHRLRTLTNRRKNESDLKPINCSNDKPVNNK